MTEENTVDGTIADDTNTNDQQVFDLMNDKTKELDLGVLDNTVQPPSFDDYVTKWNDPKVREVYNASKLDNPEASLYTGYVEESESMYYDISLAASESGIDPDFLYQVGMFEGMANPEVKEFGYWEEANAFDKLFKGKSVGEWIPEKTKWEYESDKMVDTFQSVGMDIFFAEMPTLIERGYLTSGIEPNEYNEISQGETGDYWETGYIKSSQVWQGIGGLLRLKEDEMQNYFNAAELDWDSLPVNTQRRWIYAAYNAGPGNAKKILEEYGADPWSDEGFTKGIKEDPYSSLANWMKNVEHVAQGTSVTESVSPWD